MKELNTDSIGARVMLEAVEARPSESVLLLGAGGVARAILFALRQLDSRKSEQLTGT